MCWIPAFLALFDLGLFKMEWSELCCIHLFSSTLSKSKVWKLIELRGFTPSFSDALGENYRYYIQKFGFYMHQNSHTHICLCTRTHKGAMLFGRVFSTPKPSLRANRGSWFHPVPPEALWVLPEKSKRPEVFPAPAPMALQGGMRLGHEAVFAKFFFFFFF